MANLRRIWQREYFGVGFNAALGAAVLLCLVYLVGRFAAAVLAVGTPFVASFVVALLLEPLVFRIQRRVRWLRGRRLPAVLLVYLLFLLGFVALLTYLVPTVVNEGQDLAQKFPDYLANVQKYVNDFLKDHRSIGPVALPHDFKALTDKYSSQLMSKLSSYASQGTDILLGSLSGLLTVVLVPIITFFLLSDLHRLRARLLFLMPERARAGFQHFASDVIGVFGNYTRGMVIVCGTYGVVAMIVFLLFGLKSYAMLLGFAAAICYAIPYIGPLTLALLSAVVALSTGHTWIFTAEILGSIFVLNLLFDNLLVPRIVGDSVGLHPLLTIFSLFLGGELFGVWGMLLSVPVAASIQLVLFRIFPRLCEPTPVAMAKRFEMPETETITRNEQRANDVSDTAGDESTDPLATRLPEVTEDTSATVHGNGVADHRRPESNAGNPHDVEATAQNSVVEN